MAKSKTRAKTTKATKTKSVKKTTSVASTKVTQKKSHNKDKKRHHLKHHPILTFGRVFKSGFKNLWRNAWLSVAATAIMTVTLSVMLLAALANKALNETIDEFSKDLKLSVYIEDDAEVSRQTELKNALEAHQLVEEVDFISKEQALQEFRSRQSSESSLELALEIIEDNPLPASFEITISDLDKANEVVAFVEAEQYEDIVEETSNDNKTAQTAIEQYTAQQRLIVLIAIIIAVIFAFISIMVIFNTIRLAIYSRSDEVQTMKLLGASHGYIRGPFLFEASMYGVVSGVLSFGFVTLLLKVLLPELSNTSFSTEGLSNSLNTYAVPFFDVNWYLILATTVLSGMMIGFFSSGFALSRYMKY